MGEHSQWNYNLPITNSYCSLKVTELELNRAIFVNIGFVLKSLSLFTFELVQEAV